VELVALVRGNAILLSSAKSSEVFSSDRYLIHEELEYDTTLLSDFRSSSSALNIKEYLRVLGVKFRELRDDLIATKLRSELLLVEALLESFSVSSSFTLGGHSFLFPNSIVDFTDSSVLRIYLVSLASIL